MNDELLSFSFVIIHEALFDKLPRDAGLLRGRHSIFMLTDELHPPGSLCGPFLGVQYACPICAKQWIWECRHHDQRFIFIGLWNLAPNWTYIHSCRDRH